MGVGKKLVNGQEVIMAKMCRNCYRIVSLHVAICPGCSGTEFVNVDLTRERLASQW